MTPRLLTRVLAVLSLAAGAASAQTPSPSPAPAPTGAIRGRILAADTGRPLRRAQISLSAPELAGQGRSTTTTAEGRYQFKDLPAGRYSITVARSGYLSLRYGQRRPLEPGRPLQLADRQSIEHVDFSLPRMGVIAGRVFDETGDPIAGVTVFAMRQAYFDGRRRMVPASGGARTDDIGQYRILGLPPGSYYVAAVTHETWTVATDGRRDVMGFAPTYFPGTALVGDAKRLTLAIGQEARGTDFALVPGRTATVSGTAIDAQGRPMAGQSVNLTQEFRSSEAGGMFMGAGSATIAPDGTFSIRNVPPGEYALQARVTSGGGVSPEVARLPIVVAGADVKDVSLVAASAWTMSGFVTTEEGAPPAFARDRLRISVRPLNGTNNPRAGAAQIKDDWSFAAPDITGAARMSIAAPDGWMVKQVLHNGRDIGDATIDSKSGEPMTDVQIVLTSRVTSVSGQVLDDKGDVRRRDGRRLRGGRAEVAGGVALRARGTAGSGRPLRDPRPAAGRVPGRGRRLRAGRRVERSGIPGITPPLRASSDGDRGRRGDGVAETHERDERGLTRYLRPERYAEIAFISASVSLPPNAGMSALGSTAPGSVIQRSNHAASRPGFFDAA
jgi:protocatechuate 3,4-dioxygenase beta subunit